MGAPFPFAPRQHVVAELRAALAKARNEYVTHGQYEDAYRCLREAAIVAVCDLESTDLRSWEELRDALT